MLIKIQLSDVSVPDIYLKNALTKDIVVTFRIYTISV